MQPIFRYTHLDTPMHRLHPLVKLAFILLTLILILIPFETRHIVVLLIWLAFSASLWVVGHIDVRRFGALIKILMGTFVFLMVVQGFTYRGGVTPLIVFGHVRGWGGADLGVLTLEGVLFGAMLSVRILAAASSLPLFVMTTPVSAIMTALSRLRVPHTATFMFVSALSFTSLIFEMWSSIIDAQKLRAFDIDSMGVITKARKAYVPIVTPLILLLFRKANDFQIALETKGFGAPVEPTPIEELAFRRADYLWLALFVAVFSACLIIRFRL